MLRAVKSRAILFQPTRPLRDATVDTAQYVGRMRISTHASLAGRDEQILETSPSSEHFNPRVPCGTRLQGAGRTGAVHHFNPRVPCGTRPESGRGLETIAQYFNPRVPCGTRRMMYRAANARISFQPTRPLRDATHARAGISAPLRHFNPRVPCGTRR